MDEIRSETLDLSRRGLKKIEKAPLEETQGIITLVLDQNELQKLDNIDAYARIENLSICNNFLVRMHSVSRLTNLRILSLNNNGILQIEGLKELTYLKVLKLAGNNIKTIEHLNHNMHLEHLDLSTNQITFIADISYLKGLKHLNLERNRIVDLRQCDRYLPAGLAHLGLAHNNMADLNEVAHLVHLGKLDTFSIQGNPCVAMAGKDKLGFDYRPFVLNWIMSVKTIDGFVVSAIESLKAEWLYSQGKGRHYHAGQHQELCDYLASTCPLTADALETEDQRKLRLILSKAQHHQQQLKDHQSSPIKSKIQSPRMQSRISTPRHMGRSPDRLSSSYHPALSRTGSVSSPSHAMSMSCSGEIPTSIPMLQRTCDEQRSFDHTVSERTVSELSKPANQALEAASKMVPVPESLMSPDYQDPMYDLQRSLRAPNAHTQGPNVHTHAPNAHTHATNAHTQGHCSPASNGSSEDKARSSVKNLKGSPRQPKSATSSPKLRSRMEQRKGSLTTTRDEKTTNGVSEQVDLDKLEIVKLASNQRRQKKMSAEATAAVVIQKMWRGYRSRNLNKDTLRILHAIQAARARQHIQRLTCDMEATKAALESERKIQQLQMQAINALWKKVSTLQTSDSQKKTLESDEHTDALRQLTETCCSLQAQVVELQGSMQQVLRSVSRAVTGDRCTQTDIIAVATPQEERSAWLRRPQTLSLAASSAPTERHDRHDVADRHDVTDRHDVADRHTEPTEEGSSLGIERTESVIEEATQTVACVD